MDKITPTRPAHLDTLKLPSKFNLTQLNNEIQSLINSHPFDHTNQICLTSRSSSDFSFYNDCGSLYDFEERAWKIKESEHIYLNPEIKNTYLEQVIFNLETLEKFKFGRIRIMNLKSKACYSLHYDEGTRVHIPIVTNSQCFLIFKPGQFEHLPADGSAYLTNTLKFHTAMNGGSCDRIHLVFSVVKSSKWHFSD